MEAPLRRRSTLENGITAVLLVGITPPLPLNVYPAHQRRIGKAAGSPSATCSQRAPG
jgi:hypothetical protein